MEIKNVEIAEPIERAIRSEEVQEIMERMPASLIKWGSGAMLLLLLILISLSAIINYPDTINGNALLTTRKPPIAITAQTHGMIEKIFVEDKDRVKADNSLAIIKNRTDYKIVFWFDSILHSKKTDSATDPDFMHYSFWTGQKKAFDELGDLTSAFSGFLSSLKSFEEINKNKAELRAVLRSKGEKKLYDRAWYAIMQTERLRNAVLLWQETYLLKAPISGIVSFQTPRVENQELKDGEEFCRIISTEKEIICRVLIPLQGAAKVQPDQKIRIILASHPENEYGFIEGRVKSVSPTPLISEEGNSFVVTAEVPQRLITSIKKEIAYLPEMQGRAEIITEKKTILERITDVFMNYWKKNS